LSDLIVSSKKQPNEDGSVVKITPESAGWGYVGFEVLRLGTGETAERRAESVEVCLVSLSGVCAVTAGDHEWEELGGRESPFDGPPHGLYLPPGTGYRIEARTDLELAVCSAPAERGAAPLLVRPEDVEVEVRGYGALERRIHPILMEDRPAERLLVVEVLTPSGHWSSYPPHKHDEENPPTERYLEETYYHRIRPQQGFALQRVYSEDRSLDDTLAFGDGDVVLVPKGYHVVSAPPGYDLYYLNVMAGPEREWKIRNDPDHEWLLD
jgi:5-deoxy-glucuronate isomerase